MTGKMNKKWKLKKVKVKIMILTMKKKMKKESLLIAFEWFDRCLNKANK